MEQNDTKKQLETETGYAYRMEYQTGVFTGGKYGTKSKWSSRSWTFDFILLRNKWENTSLYDYQGNKTWLPIKSKFIAAFSPTNKSGDIETHEHYFNCCYFVLRKVTRLMNVKTKADLERAFKSWSENQKDTGTVVIVKDDPFEYSDSSSDSDDSSSD